MALGADDLARLSTLVYQPGFRDVIDRGSSKSLGAILQKMQTEGATHDEWTSDEQFASLIEALSSNPEVARLEVVDFSGPDEHFGQTGQNLTLVDNGPERREMYVVFRGTGSADEWRDNFEGLYSYDTPAQKNASDYIDRMMEGREGDWRVVVSGHSKGGNKAMYAAITNPCVDECYSFDGQGFSTQFFNKYGNEIAARRSRIHSYNYKGDFVSALLCLPTKDVHFTGSWQGYMGPGELLNTILRGDGSFLPKNHAPVSLFVDGSLQALGAASEPSDYWLTINDFSLWIMENVPEGRQRDMVSFIAGCIDVSSAASACGGDQKQVIAEFVGDHPEWLGALVGSIIAYPRTAELATQLVGTDEDFDGLIDVIKVDGVPVAGVVNFVIYVLIHLMGNGESRPVMLRRLLSICLGLEVDDEWIGRFEAATGSTERDIERGVRGTEAVRVMQDEPRDWTEARRQELLAIVDAVGAEAWRDATSWDTRRGLEGLAGWISVDGYADNMGESLRRQVGLNATLREGIGCAFEAAWAHDAGYACAMRHMAREVSAAAARLDEILP